MSGSTSNQDPSILLSIVESKFDMDDSDALPDQGSGEDNPMDLLSTKTIEKHIMHEGAKKVDRHAITEMILYAAFLIIFSFVLLNQRDAVYSFWYNELMKDLFLGEEFPSDNSTEHVQILKTFYDVATTDELWQWMNGVFVPNLLSFEDNETGLLYGVNRLVGTIRIRTQRVQNRSCVIAAPFRDTIDDCYGRWSFLENEEEPYGGPNGTTYFYNTSDQVGGNPTLARLQTYGGGGYMQELYPLDDYEVNEALVFSLEENGYLDQQSRVMFIDFSTFNANINMFNVAQMVFEFLPSGGVVPSAKFRVLRLYAYEPDVFGTFQLLGEVMVVFFVAFYLVQEINEMRREGRRYWGEYWNYFDVLNVMLFIVSIGFKSYIAALFSRTAIDPLDRSFYNMGELVFWQSSFNVVSGINAFLLWFKIFKYTSFYPMMRMIALVIGRAAASLASFLVMFMMIMFGFAQAGNLAFGMDVWGYRSFTQSVITLSVAMLGDFDFDALQFSNRAFGPLFFFSYIVIVFLIILSMLLAIVDRAYEEINDMLAEEIEKASVMKAIGRRGHAFFTSSATGKKLLHLLSAHEKIDGVAEAIGKADKDGDGQLTKIEAIAGLKDDPKFADLFDKYDINNDGLLSPEERAALLAEIESRKEDIDKEIHKEVTKKDLFDLNDNFEAVNTHVQRVEEQLSKLQRDMAEVVLLAQEVARR